MSGRRAWSEIIQDRATPQAAAEKAFKRVEEIFAKYRLHQLRRIAVKSPLRQLPPASLPRSYWYLVDKPIGLTLRLSAKGRSERFARNATKGRSGSKNRCSSATRR